MVRRSIISSTVAASKSSATNSGLAWPAIGNGGRVRVPHGLAAPAHDQSRSESTRRRCGHFGWKSTPLEACRARHSTRACMASSSSAAILANSSICSWPSIDAKPDKAQSGNDGDDDVAKSLSGKNLSRKNLL